MCNRELYCEVIFYMLLNVYRKKYKVINCVFSRFALILTTTSQKLGGGLEILKTSFGISLALH